MFTTVDKAMAAFVGGFLALLMFAGFDISAFGQAETWLVPMLSALFAYLFPNKQRDDGSL